MSLNHSRSLQPTPQTQWKTLLVYRACWRHARVEFDFAEGAFVARYILLEKSKERFRLLRADINALKITNLYLSFALLLQGAEDHEEIPDIHPHLHAVGIIFAIVGAVRQLNIRLWRSNHR